MKKYQLSAVNSPSIEFECGGHLLHSDVIRSVAKNPNFSQPVLFLDVVSITNIVFIRIDCSVPVPMRPIIKLKKFDAPINFCL